MWPSRWLTGTSGSPSLQASVLAIVMPTSSEPARPGALGHRDGVDVRPVARCRLARAPPRGPGSSSAGGRARRPRARCRPVGAWSATWLATTLETMRRPPSTTATAVSSQEVSTARMRPRAARPTLGRGHRPERLGGSSERVRRPGRRPGRRRRSARRALAQARPSPAESSALGGHDERVLAVVRVVARPDAHGPEAEALVEPARRRRC